jgi:hypothetical protein
MRKQAMTATERKELLAVLGDLLDWEEDMGGWRAIGRAGAPVWSRARRAYELLQGAAHDLD